MIGLLTLPRGGEAAPWPDPARAPDRDQRAPVPDAEPRGIVIRPGAPPGPAPGPAR